MSKLTDEMKRKIDDMSRQDLLTHWATCPINDPMINGEVYEYFVRALNGKSGKIIPKLPA